MIRYDISLADIESRVDVKVPNWRKRAQLRTRKLIQKGAYYEKTQIWSEVKPVFADLQYKKCIFCEQQLEGGPQGYIQHDLEHFRPKGAVEAWPLDRSVHDYAFVTGEPHPPGYYCLAYHLGNYAAACKVCNTLFKLNYFPIAGVRVAYRQEPEHGTEPSDYLTEDAHLIYPIGDADPNPRDLITFVGYQAIPVYEAGREYERARVTINFLELNRDWLLYSRSWSLLAVWDTWQNVQRGNDVSKRTLRLLTSDAAPHTNCTNAFVRLCEMDLDVAEALVPQFQDKIEEEMEFPENKLPNNKRKVAS